MLSGIYRKVDNADAIRSLANKLNNIADNMDSAACDAFNKKIRIDHIKQLYECVDEKGSNSEKEIMQMLLNTKHKEDLDIECLKKYKHLEEMYGENLDYNKSIIDRFIENMGE